MIVSDAVLTQLISTIGTILTVVLTSRRLRQKARKEHEETNKKLDRIGASVIPSTQAAEPFREFADLPQQTHDKTS